MAFSTWGAVCGLWRALSSIWRARRKHGDLDSIFAATESGSTTKHNQPRDQLVVAYYLRRLSHQVYGQHGFLCNSDPYWSFSSYNQAGQVSMSLELCTFLLCRPRKQHWWGDCSSSIKMYQNPTKQCSVSFRVSVRFYLGTWVSVVFEETPFSLLSHDIFLLLCSWPISSSTKSPFFEIATYGLCHHSTDSWLCNYRHCSFVFSTPLVLWVYKLLAQYSKSLSCQFESLWTPVLNTDSWNRQNQPLWCSSLKYRYLCSSLSEWCSLPTYL